MPVHLPTEIWNMIKYWWHPVKVRTIPKNNLIAIFFYCANGKNSRYFFFIARMGKFVDIFSTQIQFNPSNTQLIS